MALDNYEDMTIYVNNLLIAQATKTAIDIDLFTQELRLSGATDDTITALLMADLSAGGRIFGTFRNQVKGSMMGAIEMSGRIAGDKIFSKAGYDVRKWITVNRTGKACPDCEGRRDRVEPMELWQEIGTPGSGWSLCRDRCRCLLLTEQYDGDTVILRE